MSRDEAPRPARPLVLPESFNGETDYCDWIDHFENVAAVHVKAWDDNAKLQWLKVRLTGRAQTALKRDGVKAGRGPGRRMGAGNKGWGIESGQVG